MEPGQRSFVDRRKGDTVLNVAIGAAVAFVVSTVFPLVGQALGGGVSGYLQQEGRVSGAKVGGVAAFLSGIPGVVLVVMFFVPFVLLPILGAGAGAGAEAGGLVAFSAFSGLFLVFVLAAVLFGLVTSAVVGAAGGYLGAMLFEDSAAWDHGPREGGRGSREGDRGSREGEYGRYER